MIPRINKLLELKGFKSDDDISLYKFDSWIKTNKEI